MDIIETIHKRRSVRTFQTLPVPAETLARLTAAFDGAERLNATPVRLLVVPAAQVAHGMTGLIGSYGSMVDPPHYAIGISAEGKGDQLNFGFVMEQFVLACAGEGLGTCWVGGFFRKSLLEQAVALGPGERIVCISPLGYARDRRFAERTMRALGGLNARKPLAERVFEGRWGHPADEWLATRPDLRTVFEAARWAPSASNAQPVYYVIDGERIVAAAFKARPAKYASFLGGKDHAENLDFLDVDAGISMAHIHLAARQLGLPGAWSAAVDEPALREKYAFPPEARLAGEFRFAAAR
jgi:nitroreductase